MFVHCRLIVHYLSKGNLIDKLLVHIINQQDLHPRQGNRNMERMCNRVYRCSWSSKLGSGPTVLPVRDWAFMFSNDLSRAVSSWLACLHHLNDLGDLLAGLVPASAPHLLLVSTSDPESLNLSSPAVSG
jgi:hypothetical protein